MSTPLESYISYCITFSHICILIQTVKLRSERSLFSNENENKTNHQYNSRNEWYKRVLLKNPFRFYSHCSIDIPSVRYLEMESLVQYFHQSSFYFYNKDSRHMSFPDFLILPFVSNSRQSSEYLLPIVNYHYNVKILQLHLFKTEIYLACVPCMPEFVQTFQVNLIPNKSLQHLQKIFDDMWVNRFFENLFQRNYFEHDYEDFWNSTLYCAYNGKNVGT